MESESDIKPKLVERYQGLVRINYDVQEEQHEDIDGTKRTIYIYRMLELSNVNMSVEELTTTLIYDKYDKATQIKMVSDDYEKITLALFTAKCLIYAKKILGIKPSLEDVKTEKLAEINKYDISSAVNSFTIGNTNLWLNRTLRGTLMRRLEAEKSSGVAETTLWHGNKALKLNVDKAITMLNAIEIYASKCYDVTASHKAKVEALNNIDAVKSYDYTVGYPESLAFNVVK